MQPPKITDGTVPITDAATPLSDCPSSFDEFTKMELTEDTRPRISSGTNNCTIVPRMITLTPSNNPLINKAAKLSQKFFEIAKIKIQMPNPATTYSNDLPCLFFNG